MWRFIIVALALTCLVLLGWYAVRKVPGKVEASLQARAQKVLDAKVPGVTVRFSQRDAVLAGSVRSEADRKAAELLVSELSGVKKVTQNQITTAVQVPPAPTPEPTPEPIKEPTPEVVSPSAAEVAEVSDTTLAVADAAPEVAAEVADAAPEVADSAPAPADSAPAPEVAIADAGPDTASAAAEVKSDVVAVDPGGALDAKQCRDLIAAHIDGDKRITFKGPTGRISEEGDKKVQEIVAILTRCPTAKGIIEAHHDDYGEPDKIKTLTQIRAYNVWKRVVELGIDRKRFKYAGLGYHQLKYKGTPALRLLNQRVEFNITVE